MGPAFAEHLTATLILQGDVMRLIHPGRYKALANRTIDVLRQRCQTMGL